MGSNFAAVRLIAASAVVLGHGFVLAGAEPPTLFGTPVHVLAVRVFFVVSGYLVCGSWERDPVLPRFLGRRALRILPGVFDDGRAFTAVNGSLWSLPVEVAMYLLLPPYARRWLLPVVAAGAVVGAVAFTVVWPGQVQPVVWATSIPFGWRFTALAAPVVVALAALSWCLVERPALRWKPGRGGVVRVGTA